jgi:chromosome segregation ATPase
LSRHIAGASRPVTSDITANEMRSATLPDSAGRDPRLKRIDEHFESGDHPGLTSGEVAHRFEDNIRSFGNDESQVSRLIARVRGNEYQKQSEAIMMPSGRRAERTKRAIGGLEAGRKSAGEWQDTAVELIRSLMDNLVSTRSVEVKRRCMQSIENEAAKLAYDSAILHRERMRFDETAEASLEELQRLDRDIRDTRFQLSKAEERAAAAERRLRETQVRLTEAERTANRLQPEEGCRERLVEALRQLDEESKARQHADLQVRIPRKATSRV